MPVDKENMNYTVVILGFVFFAAGGWYVADARKWYKGPVANIDEDEESSELQSTSSGAKNSDYASSQVIEEEATDEKLSE